MKSENPTPAAKPAAEPYDFSLVLGGPLYQLFRRAHLSGDTLELLRRRIIVIALFAWLPLLVLSVVEGHAWGSGVTMPFLYDVDAHVRFLIALPLLVVAELVVHQRMRPVIRQFVERGLIADAARAKFDAALASALRLRNSVVAEVGMIAFVYGVGVLVIWRTHTAVDVASWYGATAQGRWQPSLAGWWFGCVSLPLFQFILLRWYFRLFVWARFLWHVSRIELKLVPTHPDRCGGLGFLANVVYRVCALAAGPGRSAGGDDGQPDFLRRGETAAVQDGNHRPGGRDAVRRVGAVAGFHPGPGPGEARRPARIRLAGPTLRARRSTRSGCGAARRPEEALLGSADIQSLADLGNSFEVVRGMRSVPFTKEAVVQLAVLTLLPLLPLMLTMISFEELLEPLLKSSSDERSADSRRRSRLSTAGSTSRCPRRRSPTRPSRPCTSPRSRRWPIRRRRPRRSRR